MTKQYNYTREALAKVRKARMAQDALFLPAKLLPAVYVALASMERYLKDHGKDAPDPNEPVDLLLPKDLYDPENDAYFNLTPADLLENGGGLAFFMPLDLMGYTPWKVHTGMGRPEGVRSRDKVRIMLKGSDWKPGQDPGEYTRMGSAEKFIWDQMGNRNDILFWCKEGA